MLHVGLDLSRCRLDVCCFRAWELVAQTAVPPDGDGLRGLAGRVGRLAARRLPLEMRRRNEPSDLSHIRLTWGGARGRGVLRRLDVVAAGP
jgi:hypothetical protein